MRRDGSASRRRRWGLHHRILTWRAKSPLPALQERARDARYGLLVELARETGASHLVTAHTLDDQAETILMRLSRGSGLTGLRGMAVERNRDGIRHVRPLLDIPKATLVELCTSQGWRFVSDPSNRDERFARVRWRSLMPALAAEGLTGERLAELARRARQAEEALDLKAAEAYGRARLCDRARGSSSTRRILATEPFRNRLADSDKGLSEAGLQENARRLNRLETCVERLREAVHREAGLRMNIAGAAHRAGVWRLAHNRARDAPSAGPLGISLIQVGRDSGTRPTGAAFPWQGRPACLHCNQ